MTSASKRKGDRAEREAAALVSRLLAPTRRRLGAGRQDDVGDLDGLDDVAIQVANWADVRAAAISKPTAAEQQRANAGARYAATFVRFRGGQWRVVLTPEQWARYYADLPTSLSQMVATT